MVESPHWASRPLSYLGMSQPFAPVIQALPPYFLPILQGMLLFLVRCILDWQFTAVGIRDPEWSGWARHSLFG